MTDHLVTHADRHPPAAFTQRRCSDWIRLARTAARKPSSPSASIAGLVDPARAKIALFHACWSAIPDVPLAGPHARPISDIFYNPERRDAPRGARAGRRRHVPASTAASSAPRSTPASPPANSKRARPTSSACWKRVSDAEIDAAMGRDRRSFRGARRPRRSAIRRQVEVERSTRPSGFDDAADRRRHPRCGVLQLGQPPDAVARRASARLAGTSYPLRRRCPGVRT